MLQSLCFSLKGESHGTSTRLVELESQIEASFVAIYPGGFWTNVIRSPSISDQTKNWKWITSDFPFDPSYWIAGEPSKTDLSKVNGALKAEGMNQANGASWQLDIVCECVIF